MKVLRLKFIVNPGNSNVYNVYNVLKPISLNTQQYGLSYDPIYPPQSYNPICYHYPFQLELIKQKYVKPRDCKTSRVEKMRRNRRKKRRFLSIVVTFVGFLSSKCRSLFHRFCRFDERSVNYRGYENNVRALIGFCEVKPTKTDDFLFLNPTKFSAQDVYSLKLYLSFLLIDVNVVR